MQLRPEELDMDRTGCRLVPVWAAAALILVAALGVAHASAPTATNATFTQQMLTGFDIMSAGPNMIFDRPFFLAIYDHATETVVFLGQITDPT
jgi:serine protease inhibitor